MIKISILAVGKIKETDFASAISEYKKRLSAFCELNVIEIKPERLPENPSEAEIEAALKAEETAIISKIPKNAAVYPLGFEGRSFTSEAFAEKIGQHKDAGENICFIIGGSHGLSESIKRKGETISFSSMTFPHRLFRVMLLEQIYRAFTINAGKKYHK